MRLTALGALAAAILLIPGLATAQSQDSPREGLYLDIRGGTPTELGTSDVFDTVFEVALGQAYANNLRFEIALGFSSDEADISSFGTNFNLDGVAYTGMLNGYYDFDYGGLFTPYIGLGVGGALFDVDISALGFTQASDSDLVYAYRGTTGISYDSSPGVSFNLSYNYIRTGNPKVSIAGVGIEGRVRAHVVMIGVRVGLDDLSTCCRSR